MAISLIALYLSLNISSLLIGGTCKAISIEPSEHYTTQKIGTVEDGSSQKQQRDGGNNLAKITVNSSSLIAAGYLFAEDTSTQLNLSNHIDAFLSNILDRTGPDMRPSRDYNDFKDITVEVAKRAWLLLHEHASTAVRQRLELAIPAIRQLLIESNVSDKCKNSVEQLVDGTRRMDSWAIKLLNSWGNFPSIGLFEGTYSDTGSFHVCVDIPKNRYIDHAHYCTINYRPVIPSRKDYEPIVRKVPSELLHIFDRSSNDGVVEENTQQTSGHQKLAATKNTDQQTVKAAFEDILNIAQYHHYMYYKWGTCWPIGCSPFDIKRVAKLLARKNILMNGPVKCFSKFSEDYEEMDSVIENEHTNRATITFIDDDSRNSSIVTTNNTKKLVISVWDANNGIYISKPFFIKSQKIALSVIVAISLFISCMTTIDLFTNKVRYIYREFRFVFGNASPASSIENIHNHQQEQEQNQSSLINSDNVEQPIEREVTDSHGIVNVAPTQTIISSYFTLPQLQETTGDASTSQHKKSLLRQQDQTSFNGNISKCEMSAFMRLVKDCSIINNTNEFFSINERQLKNDILCLNGIRCITMIWIILTHTMMYNDWSAFARSKEIEKSVTSLIGQPLFNGSYLVDTFFLMSGLLSAFTTFKQCKGLLEEFNSLAYIFSRWLRLTPQVLFVTMLYILLPLVSWGPHWFPMVGEQHENCIENWWINVFHLQAFYKSERICSFITWWVSVDFFYHIIALAIIWIILTAGHLNGFLSIVALVLSQVSWLAIKHYRLGLPPNILSTIPQMGAMWTVMTLNFFWTPYAHAVPYFFGFYLGYLMALKRNLIVKSLNTRRAIIGWLLTSALFFCQSFSTYWWVADKSSYSKLTSTIFHIICPIIWSSSISWTIIACQHGYGGLVNRILSWKIFIVLGRASYMIYLSHYQVLLFTFGNQTVLLEPTALCMLFLILGVIFLSTLFGIFLCIVFEFPLLKQHRKLMKYVQ